MDDLKKSLARVFENERAPDALRAKVQSALTDLSPRLNRTGRSQKWVIPLGMAAAVALVWFGSAWLTGPLSTVPGESVEAQWVAAVRLQHIDCLRMGDAHRQPSLPAAPAAAGNELTRRLGFHVLAPDLSDLGFEFQSADVCGFGGRRGAHLIYRAHQTGVYLSIFSVEPLIDIKPTGGLRIHNHPCFSCEKGDCNVLAWSEGDVSYALCGEPRPDEMVRLASAGR